MSGLERKETTKLDAALRADLSQSAIARIEQVKAEADEKLAYSLRSYIYRFHRADHRQAKKNLGSSAPLAGYFARYLRTVFNACAEAHLAAMQEAEAPSLGAYSQTLSYLGNELVQSIISPIGGIWRRVVADVCDSLEMGDEKTGYWFTPGGSALYSVAGLMEPHAQPLKFALRLRVRFWETKARLVVQERAGQSAETPESKTSEVPVRSRGSGILRSKAAHDKQKTAFGKKIDQLRRECGLSFADLATAVELDRSTVMRHVNHGGGAHPGTIKQYADTFSEKLGREITVQFLQES